MARQEPNFNLPDNKPMKEESIFIDMGTNSKEYERLCKIIYDGVNSLGLQMIGSNLMESEFVEILLDSIRRQELIRKYEMILNNFPVHVKGNGTTIYFPDIYITEYGDRKVKNEKGEEVLLKNVPIDAKKTPIGEFFGGWQKRNNITTRYEDNNGLKQLHMSANIKFPVNIVGDRYNNFISDINTLYKIVVFIDTEFKKEEYQIKTIDDLTSVPKKQKEFINKTLEGLINSGNTYAKSLPYKEVGGNILFIESDLMKGNIIKFLSTPNTAFLNEGITDGTLFNDRYFTVDILKHIINSIIGERNYIMLMSEPLPGNEETVGGKQYRRYFVRCIYMDKLGNIGYSQVESSSQYGAGSELQQQRAIQGLVARQAIIMAFPAFKSLKQGKGIDPQFKLYREEWRKRKDKVLKSGKFMVTCDSKMHFRIEPKKDSDIKIDEYNLGLVTDTLYIYEEKIPKRPLLIEKRSEEPKKTAKIEEYEEERKIGNEEEVVDMEEEKKEEHMEEE